MIRVFRFTSYSHTTFHIPIKCLHTWMYETYILFLYTINNYKMFIHMVVVYAWFDFINKKHVQIKDPFFDSDSTSQVIESTEHKSQENESSSTNKEVYDDIADNKLLDTTPLLQSNDVILRNKTIDEFTKAFVNTYDLGDTVQPITNKDMWNRLYEYIHKHFDMFIIDGTFSIQLQIRYVMCSYVIAFIPAEFAIVIPGFYTYLIPKKAYDIPIIKDALQGMKRFFKFCKQTSHDSLFITFYFGRANSILEDFAFIKQIPVLITSDPLQILREFLAFQIKAEGYDSK